MEALTIILVVVVAILIFFLVKYAMSDTTSLQDALQNGQNATVIKASDLATSATPSSNFAYSSWFYVNDWNYRYGEPKVLYGRMGATSSSKENGSIEGVSGLDPCPAVVFGAVENNLNISLGCYPGIDQTPTTPGGNTVIHTCVVANVPIQKWVHLVISVYGRTLDVYIDGKLVKTCLLPGVANVNPNADLMVTPGGGFDGWTAKLAYFPNALNPQEAWNLYTKAPTGWMSNLPSYQVQLSLQENGTTKTSVTI